MTYGFSIRNSSNEIVVDSAFRNFEVIQQSAVSQAYSTGYFEITYPYVELPMLFVKIPNSSAIFVPGKCSNTSARFLLSGSSVAEYMICSPRTDGAVGSDAGVWVKDESSRVVFSSNRQYAKVLAGFNFTAKYSSTSQSISHDAADYASYICGQFMGISGMWCSWAGFWTITRPNTSQISVNRGSPNPGGISVINWLAGGSAPPDQISYADLGPGTYQDVNNYPLLIARP